MTSYAPHKKMFENQSKGSKTEQGRGSVLWSTALCVIAENIHTQIGLRFFKLRYGQEISVRLSRRRRRRKESLYVAIQATQKVPKLKN